MRKALLYSIALLLLVQMASANPYDYGLGQLPTADSGSFYPDPEGLLNFENLCTICGELAHECIHSQRRPTLWLQTSPFERSDFLSHPDYPAVDPNTNTMPMHTHSAPAAPETQYLQNLSPHNANAHNPGALQGWLSPTYNPGDRLQSPSESLPPRKRTNPVPQGFRCGSCGLAFDRDCDLTRHKKSHLNDADKPKKCPHCLKGFIYPKDLRRHLNTHEGQRHYFCNVPGCKSSLEGFTRKDNYNRHMRQKHSESSNATAPSISGASTN